MSHSESTAITDLVRMVTTRRLDPIPRDSEPTMIVERTAFVPELHMPAPPPASYAVIEPPISTRLMVATMATAIALGVILGILVSIAS
jgi:hypothetical protein